MSAVIQGASGGLGFALARHVLKRTDLKLYALTRSKSELEARLQHDRCEVLEVDVKDEGSIQRAAAVVKDVRLIACMAGILHPEKSLKMINADDVIDTFRINTIGHLLVYKHFVPRLEKRDGLNLCMSLSARVGSISDNEKGGWYSYRSSKAALNQVIRTLDHELGSRAVAIGYHPGTVLDEFTRPVIGDAQPNREKGVLTVDEAVEHMTSVMGNVQRSWGGQCWDWRGKRVKW